MGQTTGRRFVNAQAVLNAEPHPPGAACGTLTHHSLCWFAKRKPRPWAGRLPWMRGFRDGVFAVRVRRSNNYLRRKFLRSSSLRLTLLRGIPLRAFLLWWLFWFHFRKSSADSGYSGREGSFLSHPFHLGKESFLCCLRALCPRCFLFWLRPLCPCCFLCFCSSSRALQ
jgi:hypothetical protein